MKKIVLVALVMLSVFANVSLSLNNAQICGDCPISTIPPIIIRPSQNFVVTS
ncbi:hypothetical protein CLV62_14628 [Dysgonomonas alginatilytica]|uniref:Uncharacterized protein n=1 Tax=Dysgonomonas alginatilytica TaxID=1605892 RepID=A0A2V3PJV2_9BACT|nr:hypothetical protein [Dysgonomonas alginatilytica]PXV58477.1 hypothetical protein CLV62_14628 [Dysgonomonas alginatilytica]